jgi:hypothetical protein
LLYTKTMTGSSAHLPPPPKIFWIYYEDVTSPDCPDAERTHAVLLLLTLTSVAVRVGTPQLYCYRSHP